MSENKDDIEQILKDFQKQRENKEHTQSSDPFGELEPPKRYDREIIDFSKAPNEEQTEPEEANAKKVKAPKLKREKKNTDYKRILKPVGIIILAVAVAVGAIFTIKFAVEQSKVAYLKPYEKKYNIEYPVGIMEKYCDIYGENPTAMGYIKISELGLEAPVLPQSDGTNPVGEINAKSSNQNNFVVYLNDNSLEKYYKDAESFNSLASGFISYSDLFKDYNFKVVGAFYTNTKAEDDNGYIFPYNVTEEMTDKSENSFIDRLHSRFLYDTGITLTRNEKLLTISCPTDFRPDFRFVVVGVLRKNTEEKFTATEKAKVHYPQTIYDESGEKNPFFLASKWYPEIVLQNADGTTKTKKQSIKDYE